MKWFKIIAVGVSFAITTFGLLILIIGAVMFAHAIVTDGIPTGIEWISMIFVMLVGGAIGAMLFINDTEE